MARTKNINIEKSQGVMLTVTSPALKGDPEQEFTKEHAERILALQEAQGRADWVLSEGQGLIYKNGIISSTDSGTSKEGT